MNLNDSINDGNVLRHVVVHSLPLKTTPYFKGTKRFVKATQILQLFSQGEMQRYLIFNFASC